MSDADALQSCLAAEHAAVYGYGVLAAVINQHTPHSSADRRASSYFRAHRQQRDELIERLTKIGGKPVAAEAGYRLPFVVHDVAAAAKLARLVESRCAATYASAVSQSTSSAREYLARRLADPAVASVRWGARPVAFPGTSKR